MTSHDAATVEVAAELDLATAAQVLDLAGAAALVDGGEPLSEDARLALSPGAPDTPSTPRHVLLRRAGPGEQRLLGYAQLTGAEAELLVAPTARRRGHARRLVDALAGAASQSAHLTQATQITRAAPGPLRIWSHAQAPATVAAAAAAAAAMGFTPVRELWRMSRPLGPVAPLPPLVLPPNVALRPFERGRDEQAWLAVNAAAFATHPEQGRWTRADLELRLDEPWFDSAGLLLAVDAQEGGLLASHWTKELPGGAAEVYVVAVAPSAQGQGLGAAVVLAGLHHLDLRGRHEVHLYVEGDNSAATRLYTRLGFTRDGADLVYQRG